LPATLCNSNGTANTGSAFIIIDEGEVSSAYITNSLGNKILTDINYPINNNYLFSNLPFDDYTAIVVDYQNNIYQKNFQIPKSNVLKYNYTILNMAQSSSNLSLNCSDITDGNINKGLLIINNIYIIDPITSLPINNGEVNIELINITSGNTILLNATISYNISTPITYYLCSGSYQLILTNPNCSEDTTMLNFNITEPQALDFFVNTIDYNIIKNLSTYDNWNTLAKWSTWSALSNSEKSSLLTLTDNQLTIQTIDDYRNDIVGALSVTSGDTSASISYNIIGGVSPYAYLTSYNNTIISNNSFISNTGLNTSIIIPTITNSSSSATPTYSFLITDSKQINCPNNGTPFQFYLFDSTYITYS
jgi:hypothetical protein